MKLVRIGLIGDCDPAITAHVAIPRALELAATASGYTVEATWLATSRLAQEGSEQLAAYDALWCVPGSPYASMEGALDAIRFARESGTTFLGTCGGFQHALIEYARNVLGLADADHAETNPDASLPFISMLACSLVEANDQITLLPNSRISAIYGATEVTEMYRCRFGINPQYQSLLDGSAMAITGVGADGEARVVELKGHPFFIATLFQPERSALAGRVHPLITAYVQAAARKAVPAEDMLAYKFL